MEFTGFDDADINHNFRLLAARVCSSRMVAREEEIIHLFEYGYETRVDFSYRSVSNARFFHGLLGFDRNPPILRSFVFILEIPPLRGGRKKKRKRKGFSSPPSITPTASASPRARTRGKNSRSPITYIARITSSPPAPRTSFWFPR